MEIFFNNDDISCVIDADTPIESMRQITGWIGSKHSIAKMKLICGNTSYSAVLSPGRADVIDVMQYRYNKNNIHSFSISYNNQSSIFFYDTTSLYIHVTFNDESCTKSLKIRLDAEDFLHKDIHKSSLISHDQWLTTLINLCDKPGASVLEIGSRKCNNIAPKKLFKHAQHTGLDIYPGENVDVIGDAHQLEHIFKGNKFDLIFSSAVFEHLAMPWIVAQQIIRLLKIGGYVFVETHFTYSSHERPWHFFQFSDMALRVLFPDAWGVRHIDSGLSNPILAFFSPLADPYLRNKPVTGLYCHSEFLGKKEKEIDPLSWEALPLELAVMGTHYPDPKTWEEILQK